MPIYQQQIHDIVFIKITTPLLPISPKFVKMFYPIITVWLPNIKSHFTCKAGGLPLIDISIFTFTKNAAFVLKSYFF